MDKLKEILQENNLKPQLTNISNKGSISIYSDSLTKQGIKKNCLKILAAFEKTDAMFTDLLTESLKRNGFTDERFTDAVNYVIDNCRYPKPSIADFVSYDKNVKVYTYEEICNHGTSMYQAVRISPDQTKPVWVLKTDFETNNFIKYE